MSVSTVEELRRLAAALPLCPGVYLMKDEGGRILYVGKSKRLRNRVLSYFTGTPDRPKTARLVAQIRDFDYIVCDSEMEALTLENVLIKRHEPKYNIRLKDAKSYPYVKITAEEYPRVLVTRERKSDGGRYYGPYSGMAAAWDAANTVNRIFRLPTCRRVFPRDIGRDRPCMYRQIGRCCAPCDGSVTHEDYLVQAEGARRVLEGNISAAVATLTAQMNEAAEALSFERAAQCRDSIRALRGLCERQKVVADEHAEHDVIALYTDELCSVLSLLSVRGGALIAKNSYLLSPTALTGDEEVFAFLREHYDEGNDIPRQLLLDFEPDEEERALNESYLSERAGRRVVIRTPRRGELHRLCRMAQANARERAARLRADNERSNENLLRLTELLCLEVVPDRIEAYDISNIGREHITASMVVLNGGRAARRDYRSFRIESTDGVDDYAAMREVLRRRLRHIGDGTPSLGERPDLLLVDGGQGHVGCARAVLEELLLDIPVFGMVKDDFHKTRALVDGEREIGIAGEQGVYVMIYRLQEEAHRFAVKHSEGAKRRTLRRSSLEDIPGIGPAKAKLLLDRYGGLRQVREASEEDLCALRGLSRTDAARVFRHFHPAPDGEAEK